MATGTSGTTTFKLMVLGDSGVGKTSISRIIKKSIVKINKVIDGRYIEQAKFVVTFTGGIKKIQESDFKHVHGVLLVYSVTDTKSYENIINFHKVVLRFKDRDVLPIILVANNVGLTSQPEVSEEEGRELARKIRSSYVEVNVSEGPANIQTALSMITSGSEVDPPSEITGEKMCTVI